MPLHLNHLFDRKDKDYPSNDKIFSDFFMKCV